MDTQPDTSKGQEDIKELLYELGKEALNNRNCEEAIKQFEELLKRDANYRDTRFLLWKATICKNLRKYQVITGVGAIILLVLCGLIGFLGGWFPFSIDNTPTTEIAAITDTPTPSPPTAEPDTPTVTPPTTEPTTPPTSEPTNEPTQEPTQEPTDESTQEPTQEPTDEPTEEPSPIFTSEPTEEPPPTPKPTPTPTFTPVPLSGKIAVPVFEDGMYNIYLASTDSNWTPKPLFDRASQPAFSKDGRGMVLRSWNHRDWAQSIIYLSDYTNLAGYRQMTKFVEDAHPRLNKSNEIIFHRRRPDKEPIIVKLGTFPGAEENEDNQEELAEGENPDWLGERIIFYASFPKAGLYLMDANGNNPKLVLESDQKLVPAAAPDGDQVALSLNKNGRWQVFTFSVSQEAENLTQLTSANADHYLPTWSPDGNYIAFASNRDNNWAIWVMNADGSEQRKLFDLPDSIDGKISVTDINSDLSFGWWEERISWAP